MSHVPSSARQSTGYSQQPKPEELRFTTQPISSKWKLLVFQVSGSDSGAGAPAGGDPAGGDPGAGPPAGGDPGAGPPPRTRVTTEVAIATNASLAENFAIMNPNDDEIDDEVNFSGGVLADTLLVDLFRLRKHLKSRRFRSATPLDGDFKAQAHTYFTRADGGTTRIFILAGHGIQTGGFEVGNEMYTSGRLGTTLVDVPNTVLAIPVLCCCYSGIWINQIRNGANMVRLAPISYVLMASASSTEESAASPFYGSEYSYGDPELEKVGGNTFLAAFLRVLELGTARDCEGWDDFLVQVRQVLAEINARIEDSQVQTPEHWPNTDITPGVAFQDLIPT